MLILLVSTKVEKITISTETEGNYCAALGATGLISGLYTWECRKKHILADLGVFGLEAAPGPLGGSSIGTQGSWACNTL